MTRRYIVRPRGWLDPSISDNGMDAPAPSPTVTVWERERGPQRTGLLDQFGNDLFAVDDMEPVGFVPASKP